MMRAVTAAGGFFYVPDPSGPAGQELGGKRNWVKQSYFGRKTGLPQGRVWPHRRLKPLGVTVGSSGGQTVRAAKGVCRWQSLRRVGGCASGRIAASAAAGSTIGV